MIFLNILTIVDGFLLGGVLPAFLFNRWLKRKRKRAYVSPYDRALLDRLFPALTFQYFGNWDAPSLPILSDDDSRLVIFRRFNALELAEVGCTRPPAGWSCSRGYLHDGPCAADPAWQPIDTAPRDGTWFWVKRENLPPGSTIAESAFKWDARYGGWFAGTGWWGKDDLGRMRFTHWKRMLDQPRA